MMPAYFMLPPSQVVRTRRLRVDRDGTIAMTFGLLLLPTLFAIGVGVDVMRAYSAKMRFEAAFDNAAMALRSSAATESAAALQSRMQSYLDLAGVPGGHVALRMSDPLKPVVTVTASTSVSTTLMQLAGMRSLPLRAAAQIVRQHPPEGQATPLDGDDQVGRETEIQRPHLLQRGLRRGFTVNQD
jgi:Putative Flp pilus-assembly TadE/G-like